MENVTVNIDMYVLTWPLPSQCPFQDQNLCGNMHDQGNDLANLEIDFGNSGGKFSKKHAPIMGKYAIFGSDEDHDDIFEQRVEILRQIPPQVNITFKNY